MNATVCRVQETGALQQSAVLLAVWSDFGRLWQQMAALFARKHLSCNMLQLLYALA